MTQLRFHRRLDGFGRSRIDTLHGPVSPALMQDQRSGVAPSVRHKSNRSVDDLRDKALAELARRKAGDAPRRAAKVRLIRKAFILRERGPIDGTASLVPLPRVKECPSVFTSDCHSRKDLPLNDLTRRST